MKYFLKVFIILILVSKNSISHNKSLQKTNSIVTLIGIGDILLHSSILTSCYDSLKGFNFDQIFSETQKILRSGDLVIANMESPIAGKCRGISGYPYFNAPCEILESLKKSGVDILTTANNHALDKGIRGLMNNLKAIKKRKMIPIGTYSSSYESQQINIIEIKGIKIAVLAYTYGTNCKIPTNKKFIINIIDEDKIISDTQRAKCLGADIVCVSLHFGREYAKYPTIEQCKIARNLIYNGVDIILGCHSHVIQPYELISYRTKKGKRKKGVIVYSMGNFIANHHPSEKFAAYGLIFILQLEKKKIQSTEITGVDIVPTYIYINTNKNKRNYTVLPIRKKDLSQYSYLPISLQKYLQRKSKEILDHMKWFSSSETII